MRNLAGEARIPTSPARVLTAIACGALLCLLAGPVAGAAAHGFRHVCTKRRPGHAVCTAERLLLAAQSPSPSSPSPSKAALAARVGARRAGAVIDAKKPYAGYLTPERLHDAYALPAETAAAATQTIALVDAFDDPTAEADLAVYDEQFGLPECTSANGCFRKVNQEGAAAPLPKEEGGWAGEISIDVQMAHAICENCHILLVETNNESLANLGAGVDAAVAQGATVVSNSYDETESPSDATIAAADYDHPGVPVLAASGDCGYLNADCSQLRPGAAFPASAPGVVAVGGTSLSESGGVWTSTVWREGGSGCSSVFEAGPWQSEVADFAATGCGIGRAVADVSAIGDPNTGVDIYDSTPEKAKGPTGWGVWGGTSVASPIVAGEFGLAGGGLGVTDPAATLYGHFGQAGALVDVTSGSNGECAGATICSAGGGFDGPSGVGSPVGLEAFALAGNPTSTSPPTISGVAEVGETLEEHQGDWTGAPTGFTYQWERCGFAGTNCHQIASATGSGYTVAEGDIGSTLRVRETAHNASGPGSAESATVGPVASATPAISGFASSSGITGSRFIVEGAALDTAAEVTLGSSPASFTVLSPSRLEVIVPDGAKTGKVAVTTAHGSVTSKAKFTVTLSITSFKATGRSSVSIKGVGFTSSSTVAFDGTPASFTFISAKKLKATIPAGAGSGPITVTNNLAPAGTVSSALSFTP